VKKSGKKTLFLGSSSLLAFGWCLPLKNKDQIVLGVHDKDPELEGFDLTIIDLANLKEQLKNLNIGLIINCIGYTNIENCENNPEKAIKINTEYAGLIAKVASELMIKLVHISTDHLFDGKGEKYDEKAEKKPLNIYAKTKSDAENIILKYNQEALVIRTNFFCWGPSYRKSFTDFIIENLQKGINVSLFSDVKFTPILVSELANAIFKLVEKRCKGIYNIVSSESISKLNFGLKIANEFNFNSALIKPTLITNQKSLVKRPINMTLSSQKLNMEGIFIKSLDQQIRDLKNQRKRVIPYGRQNISKEDVKSVVDVLNSDYLTQGPVLPKFEEEVAKYCGAKFGVGVNSATSALHIACMALGLEENDILWTSPITFVASANCALYCGAKVDFLDIDSKTYNLSIKQLKKKLVIAKAENKLPKIIIPVHLSGQSCEMEALHHLSLKYNFKIIEDASHAIGGKYKGQNIGSCKFSDITVFSFHPVKIITTGEGGLCTTNNSKTAKTLARLRSHGITRHEEDMEGPSDGPWYYQQLELGFNYRMTDIQAAVGLSQMKRLDKFIKKRHKIASKYNAAFKKTSIICPFQSPDSYSSYHLYIIRIKQPSEDKLSQLELFNLLRDKGILVNLHYIPVYRHPYYKKIGYDSKNYPESERYYTEAISLPIHTLLSQEDQDYVIDQVISYIEEKQGDLVANEKRSLKGFQTIF